MKTGCMNCGSDHPMYSCLGLLALEPEPPKKLTTEESRKLVIAQVVSWYADHQIVRETENSWLLEMRNFSQTFKSLPLRYWVVSERAPKRRKPMVLGPFERF